MKEKLGLITMQKAVQDLVKENTGIDTYDVPPVNAPAPLFYVQAIGKRDASTKTSFRETIIFWIHAIAKEGKSSVGVYELIQKLEEALTDDIKLPEGHEVLNVHEAGLQSIKDDPSGEKHAVVQYEITVFYGFKVKI